ncbi:hypothetical protein PISMIDRAFT_690746 [Pisolithus microcarpus 441]|uniref:Uncharacterized protein n=1 Tax=Pisolithus microcarpus 441 TaxID=765257 RepID=A0A0C9XEP9_9AGAM|nr:hypothetical protein PISMIDRAFT_690746 [Pisolithus microcarpus 441]
MQNKEQTSPLPQVAYTFEHKRISRMSPWVCVGLNLNPVSEQIPALGISSRAHGTKNPLSKGELRT